jgi:hypothetical protein
MNKFSISYKVTEYQKQFGEILTIEQAAFITGIKPEIVSILISHEIIETVKDHSTVSIHVKYIPKLKKVIRLHYDLGVGWSSMCLVLELLNRIDELENCLKQ